MHPHSTELSYFLCELLYVRMCCTYVQHYLRTAVLQHYGTHHAYVSFDLQILSNCFQDTYT